VTIRVRLTLVFAGAMALVLAGVGLFLHLTLAHQLDQAINQGLSARGSDLSGWLTSEDGSFHAGGPETLTERGEPLAEVLDPRGRIIDATPSLGARPLIAGAALQRALQKRVFLDEQGSREPLRLLAEPVPAGHPRYVAVVGVSLKQRQEALETLRNLLLIGGPLALLLVSAAGWGLASAALRPVEAMRRRVAGISGARSGERLALPLPRDEVRRLGETLNEMLERVDGALERERTFVTDASHELRTPLAIVKTELELAQRDGRSAAELRAAIASVAEETDRLGLLAEDLLVVARSEHGQLPVTARPLPATELLEGVRRRFDGRSLDGDRPIAVETQPDDLVIVADRLRIEQALANMLDNALRHGGGRIAMTAQRNDGHVELLVADEGPGFPPEFLASAFDRFTRADAARGRGGAGLGLAIVRAIARAHGGDAGASNVDGGGASVWVRLRADGPPREDGGPES